MVVGHITGKLLANITSYIPEAIKAEGGGAILSISTFGYGYVPSLEIHWITFLRE